MTELYHKIAESSCFFQGHPGQFFTRNSLSFKVKRIYSTNDDDTINIPKYKHLLASSIIERIAKRNRGGGEIDQIKEDDLQIFPVRLIDSSDDQDISGIFEIYPRTALCTERGCHRYFELKEGKEKSCGHSNNKWEQITFIAFCDSCGRIIDFTYASNLKSDCKSCKKEKSMTRLFWIRKDDLSSFWIECENCDKGKEKLFFYDCNHRDYVSDKILFSGSKRHFRGVPTRASTVIHPAVLTTPDIPEFGEKDKTGKVTLQRKNLSAAIQEFFPNVEESKLRLPELIEELRKDEIFQKLNHIIDTCDILGFSDNNIKNISEKEFQVLLQVLLTNAKSLFDQQAKLSINMSNREKLIKKFGIDRIKEKVEKFKDFGFGEEDLQALNLLEIPSHSNSSFPIENDGSYFVPQKRTIPRSLPNKEFNELLQRYGLSQIIHISNLTMMQSLLGIIEGSTRNDPLLFNPLYTGIKKNRKPVVYVRNFYTEGLVFQLNYQTILKWLYHNHNEDTNLALEFSSIREDANFETIYRKIIGNNNDYEGEVYKLLHTFSHMLIQQSTIHTGLDVQSLAEKIYPKFAMIFLYSTSGINTGGLESTFDLHLDEWMYNMFDLALDCPQDPSCMIDENGSCNACCFVPEFVCENFNDKLDRSSLVGGSKRFRYGFLKF